MAEYQILKAVEFDKCSAKFKKQWKDGHELWRAGWLLQPKYDGCFGQAIVCPDEGQSVMLSRTGEDYTTSCLHILEELREAADELYGADEWKTFVVLGEVWHPKYKFPKISGLFRKQAASDLQFMVNDLLPLLLETPTPYAQRLTFVKELLPEIDGAQCYVKAVTHIDYDENTTPLNEALKLKDQGGYDGVILRDLSAAYTIGLANAGQIVKVKPVVSLDLVVKRVASDLGAKTGRVVYTLLVEHQGVDSFVGSGVPHILNFEVGDIVEIEAMGLTEDGKLREPRFKGVRFDKLSPDA